MDILKGMRLFVIIAERGSLSAAARDTGHSLTAVVRTLAALEAHLGVRLLNRTTRRLALTDAGQRYLAHCRGIVAAVEQAEADVSLDQHEPAGPLVITAPVLIGERLIAPLINRFVQRYPRIRCRVLLLDRVAQLLEEGIDVGIRIGQLADSSLVVRPLGVLRRHVVATPAYLDRHGRPEHPTDLVHANCITFSGAAAPWWTFSEEGREFSLDVSGNVDFNRATPALQACLDGLGIGNFVRPHIREHLEQGRLEAVLQAFEPEPRPVQIVYPHGRLLPARTRAFIDFVVQELQLDTSV